MRSPVRLLYVVVAAVSAVLMVFVLLSSAAATAAPLAPSSSSSPAVWAYGDLKTVTVGPAIAADGYEYRGSITVGYAVVIHENVTSANGSTFELHLERTMGVAISVEFCKPRCADPTTFANLSYRAYERTSAWANFTTLGTVYESGSPVHAIALVNSNSTDTSGITETAESLLPMVSGPGLAARASELNVGVTTLAGVAFSPALGLLPDSLTPGTATSWNSSSAFQAVGSGSYAFLYNFSGPAVKQYSEPGRGSYSVAPSGNVSVAGAYDPADAFSFHGVSYPAVNLTIVGPFSVREGVILVPDVADLFGSSSQAWSSDGNATSTVQTDALDINAGASAKGQFLEASAWTYALDSANPADSVSSVVGGSSLAPAMASPSSVESSTIQGQPESVGQASTDSQCLTSGIGCSSGTPRVLLGALVIGGAVVVVGAVIAAVVIAERRRLPPPVYPNAQLYPPGTAGPAPRVAGRPSPPPEPPAEEDPLDHLW